MIHLFTYFSKHCRRSLRALVLIISSFFLPSASLFSQTTIDPHPWLHLDKTGYSVNDTIKVSFHLQTLEVMYSNFGGCGGGVYWELTCHSDSMKSVKGRPSCGLLMPEFNYHDRGNFELVIRSPGTYSVQAYVKKKTEPAYNPRRPSKTPVPGGGKPLRMITSPRFEVR